MLDRFDPAARFVVRAWPSLDAWRAERPAHRSYHAGRAEALAVYHELAEPVAEVMGIHRGEVVVERPTAIDVGDLAAFATRPEAEAAARALATSDRHGWDAHVQYMGACRAYTIGARRRSARGATRYLRTDGQVR